MQSDENDPVITIPRSELLELISRASSSANRKSTSEFAAISIEMFAKSLNGIDISSTNPNAKVIAQKVVTKIQNLAFEVAASIREFKDDN